MGEWVEFDVASFWLERFVETEDGVKLKLEDGLMR